jgi:hypothetical protein
MLVSANVAAPMRTLYTRFGNVLGWLCVAATTWLMWFSRTRS